MRKEILIGIGMLIILLALAGTGSARWAYDVDCSICHISFPTPLKTIGTLFNDSHKFDGVSIPNYGTSCDTCHVDTHNQTAVPNFSMTLLGQNYSNVHDGTNTFGYAMNLLNCTYCHTNPGSGDFSFRSPGVAFERFHKFDGVSIPNNVTSCTECHTDVRVFMPLLSKGPYYNVTHRYNTTVLASELLSSPGCVSCHVDAVGNDFTLLSGTGTYLTSTVCGACHKKKYDDWYGTMHRVMLTKNTTAEAMNLPVPAGYTWANISYVIVGKPEMRYFNETGYRFKRYYANGTWANYSSSQYSCGSCHTTGYNPSGGNQSGLPGVVGTWSEEGIACENCHGAGGNGHNVTVYSKGEDCLACHYGNSRQGQAATNRHATAPAEESTSSSCTFCHSPYDNYKLGAAASLATAKNVTCLVCHDPHGTTDDKYEGLLSPGGFNSTDYSVVEDVKLSFFNGTASNASRLAGSNASLTEGNDIYDTLSTPVLLYSGSISSRKDSNYGTAPINVTGPVSEVLCSLCHYRHGLSHIASVNLTHGRNNADSAEWATCIDCHMSKSGSLADHSFDAENETNYPAKTCSKGTNCHVTSTQSTSLSNISLIPAISEWEESMHNDKAADSFYKNASYFANSSRRNSSCSKCHSPFNWNPANESGVVDAADFKGIVCAVCHNIHDMGYSITASGKKYSWYNKDAIKSGTRYKANYTLMANTTELCGNCHSNIRIGRTGPGWSTATTPLAPHGWPAKDIFVGSWKQSSVMDFECIDCHMYIRKTNDTGAPLNDSEKITGHSFAVNETGLQNTSACSSCHDGTNFGTIASVIDEIQTDTRNKWNITNTTVRNALDTINAYSGEKNLSRDMIAQAYWKLKNVEADESWGVHNPTGTDQLLDEAASLAIAANASLGRSNTNMRLYAGWNLVSLNETPANTAPISVMSSVSSNLTVVWGLNASTQTWLLYDPAGPAGLNTLTRMVKGESYEIKVASDSTWVV